MASSSALKRALSGATTGIGIPLTTTSTVGDLIHTAVAGTTTGTYDEIWLWAINRHTSDVVLTIEYGAGHTATGNIVVTLEFQSGLVPVMPGLLLQNGLDINAFASVDDVITIYGFVNAITD
jgi:hypothetical protein